MTQLNNNNNNKFKTMRGTKIQQNLKGGTSMKGVQTKFHYILKIVAKCGNPKLLGEEMSVIQWHIIEH